MLHEKISKKAIESFYEVYNKLGWGFLEAVYQNAMMIRLKKHDTVAEKERHIEVYFEGQRVGNYFADIIVDEKVILELKRDERLNEHHKYQLINYLKASNIEVGLLMNFGKVPEFKRVILTNDQKPLLHKNREEPSEAQNDPRPPVAPVNICVPRLGHKTS
jgi:GxxExxY protein